MAAVTPVIVVHGIQGSWLKDEYPVNYQDSILWTGILNRNFRALQLHQLDPSVDADAHRLTMPHQAVPLIYESLVEEVRDELRKLHPYVYAFTYDWRKDNRQAAIELGQFVDRVLNIAAVHEKAENPSARRPSKVTLIGHSMGGLVIKWYATQILKSAASRRIDRIITIATPYRGSLKAIEALLPGARNLFGMENNKSMRHAARTMPGVYQLLPTWPEAVVDQRDKDRPLNLFDAEKWQKNLLNSLKERFDAAYFQKRLNDAKSFTTAIGRPWPPALRNRVHTAYGINTETWWQVPVDTTKDNFFHFDDVRVDPGLIDPRGGDGTVHVVSSVCDEISKSRRKPDLSELKDALAGHHANMPNHGGVQDWVLKILKVNPHAAASFASPL